MIKEIVYGSSIIQYELTYEARKTLRIEVHPDNTVVVKAPPGTDDFVIDERLTRRASWILKQQRFFRILPVPPADKQYVSGEAMRYLGRQHRLKVEEGQPERVNRQGGRIQIWVKQQFNQPHIKKLLNLWYRRQAEKTFAVRLTICLQRFDNPNASAIKNNPPSLQLRVMKGRWGSCTAKSQIFLNPDLIQTPTSCIDYVITHELAHLLEHNHGPNFYRLLNRVMPDWQQRKTQLEMTRWD